MVFTPKTWEFSDMKVDEPAYTAPEAGDQYLVITDAYYNTDTQQLDVFFESLYNSAKFRIRYFMKTKEGKDNGYTARVLRTLGAAIAEFETVLSPEDLKGAVVRANVMLDPSKTDPSKVYPKVDEYYPVPEDMVYMGEKHDQYYLPNEE